MKLNDALAQSDRRWAEAKVFGHTTNKPIIIRAVSYYLTRFEIRHFVLVSWHYEEFPHEVIHRGEYKTTDPFCISYGDQVIDWKPA